MSSTNKFGRAPIYEAALKIKVAREYLTGNLGYGRLADKYSLPSPATVRFFVKWYKANYPQPALVTQPATSTDQPAPDPSDKPVLKELQLARLKIAGLEMLIQTASKELGIDITKKAGTKPSSK